MTFIVVFIILIAVIIYWWFGFNALLKYIFALFIASGFYIFTPEEATEFPWGVVFFLGTVIVTAFAIHFWTKLEEIPTEKPLSPSEQAYQEWCESKIDPEIKDYIEETYGISDKDE